MSDRRPDGFTDVDGSEQQAHMLAAMEATARWPAVVRLRAWERDHLRLSPGERLVDVGCGLGDAALALAADLAPDGAVVAIDTSEAMLNEARRRWSSPVTATFTCGDAMALDLSDAAFDAARSERTLQWVDDPDRAFAELVRVLRPGGRLVVTDSDWRTFAQDHPEPDVAERFVEALRQTRGPQAAVGGQLRSMAVAAGLEDVDVDVATHAWTSWDPDTEPSPSGFLPIDAVSQQLADAGLLSPADAQAFVAGAERYGREGRFFMTVTMVAVYGRKPG